MRTKCEMRRGGKGQEDSKRGLVAQLSLVAQKPSNHTLRDEQSTSYATKGNRHSPLQRPILHTLHQLLHADVSLNHPNLLWHIRDLCLSSRVRFDEFDDGIPCDTGQNDPVLKSHRDEFQVCHELLYYSRFGKLTSVFRLLEYEHVHGTRFRDVVFGSVEP